MGICKYEHDYDYESEYKYDCEEEGQIELDDDPVIRGSQLAELRWRYGGVNDIQTVYLAERAARESILQKRNARRKP